MQENVLQACENFTSIWSFSLQIICEKLFELGKDRERSFTHCCQRQKKVWGGEGNRLIYYQSYQSRIMWNKTQILKHPPHALLFFSGLTLLRILYLLPPPAALTNGEWLLSHWVGRTLPLFPCSSVGSLLVHPRPAHWFGEEQRKLWLCVSTAQLNKNIPVLPTVSSTNSKCSSMPAAVKKINSMPAKTSRMQFQN